MKQGRKEDRYPRWVGIHLAWASQWRGGGRGRGSGSRCAGTARCKVRKLAPSGGLLVLVSLTLMLSAGSLAPQKQFVHSLLQQIFTVTD